MPTRDVIVLIVAMKKLQKMFVIVDVMLIDLNEKSYKI